MGGKALLLGVRRFADRASAQSESPLEHRNRAPLPFAGGVLARVGTALDGLGFAVDVRLDPDRERMVDSVRSALEDGSESLILHVVSHGEVGADDTRLDVVPACGRTGLGTNVGEWVSAAQDRDRPVLLLLDLCRSGRIARLPWLLARTGPDTRTWVIAAAGPDEDAFEGRFSRAVAEVLGQLAIDGLGTDPSKPYVPLEILARRIAERVAAFGGLPQRVHATPIDPAQPVEDPPFFANPRYAPETVAVQSLDPTLREFLDQAHFKDRAGTHFTGRQRELRRLSLWLDGAAGDQPLVVTGSPGAGKSALLGVLVCAAHPNLTEEVPAVRARLDVRSCPSLNDNLAAVHARGRDVLQVVYSIADQLELPAPWRGGMPSMVALDRWTWEDFHVALKQPDKAGWIPSTLVTAVTELPEPPVIVLDALDEALDPIATLNELLLPLIRARRPDGERVCRLLVATRRNPASYRIMAEADVLDLDEVDVDELQADLERHLTSRLAEAPRYAERSARLVRERLAHAVADRLAGASSGWGAFLLAEIFLKYLEAVPVPADPEGAEQLGGSVPTVLPEALELHLGVLGPNRTLRWALAAVAFGKGDGMPAEVVAMVVGADVTDVLAQGGDYLRTSVDSDGTTLYRLFHHSLGEYLRSQHDAVRVCERLVAGVHSWRAAPPYLLRHAIAHAADADRVDELLTDSEFLVVADPDTLVEHLDLATSPAAREVTVIYRTSAWRHRAASSEERRQVLAIDACRAGSSTVARAVESTGLVPRWATGSLIQPALRDVLTGHAGSAWSVDRLRIGGEQVAVTATVDTIRLWDLRRGRPWRPARVSLDRKCHEITAFVADGRPVAAVLAGEGEIRIVDLITGEWLSEPIVHPEGVSYFAVTSGQDDDGSAVLIAGAFGGELHQWPVPPDEDEDTEPQHFGFHGDSVYFANSFSANGTTVIASADKEGRINVRSLSGYSVFADLAGHDGQVRGVGGVAHGKAVYVVSTGADDGTVRRWKLKSDRPRGKVLVREVPAGPVACTVVDDRPIALVGQGDAIHLWDLRTNERIGGPLTHPDLVSDIKCAEIDGRLVAVTTAQDGVVRVWNLDVAVAGGSSPARPGHSGPIELASCAVVGGRNVIVAGGCEDRVGRWDLADGTPIGAEFGDEGDWIAALATTTISETAVAVLASMYDHSLSLWELATGTRIGSPLEGHEDFVHAIAAATVGGRPLVISGGAEGVPRVWDLTDRTSVPLRAKPGRAVDSVAIGDAGGRPYAATWSQGDEVFVVWDIANGSVRHWTDPGFSASLVACTTVAGQPVIVAAGKGVGVFDPWTPTRLRTLALDPGWEVRTMSCGSSGGRAVILAGCSDTTVRLWDLATTECLATHAMPDRVGAVAVAPDGSIVVCCEREIIVLDPAW